MPAPLAHSMDDLTCPVCGYDTPTRPCQHCDEQALEATLAGPPHGPARGLVDGLWALPRGFLLLATTRGTKRLLLPPLILTAGAFAGLLGWAWSRVLALLEAARLQDASRVELDPAWLETSLEWLIQQSVVIWIAQAGGFLIFFVVSSFVAMWTFSIVYEALAGPFLDEIQGRLEVRFFGSNPRDALERPTDLPAATCARLTFAAGAVALLVAGLAWWLGSWLALAGALAPFLLAIAWQPEYGKWLGWVARVEGGTLLTSIKASLLAGGLLVLFLPLRLIPFGVGYLLFGAVCGFTTAISLLDIPFSRRGWSLGRRLRFLRHHWLAMIGYGAVASLLFVIPVLGPIVMVPAASVGGLWLVCRLRKPL